MRGLQAKVARRHPRNAVRRCVTLRPSSASSHGCGRWLRRRSGESTPITRQRTRPSLSPRASRARRTSTRTYPPTLCFAPWMPQRRAPTLVATVVLLLTRRPRPCTRSQVRRWAAVRAVAGRLQRRGAVCRVQCEGARVDQHARSHGQAGRSLPPLGASVRGGALLADLVQDHRPAHAHHHRHFRGGRSQ
jgi:hypothetical protein